MDDKLNQSTEVEEIDNKVTVQMVTFIIVIMVIVFTLIYFIRIYSTQKEQVLKSMETEAILLETTVSDNLNYSKHFITLIGTHIQHNPSDLKHINEVLEDHLYLKTFNTNFGWEKFSWVNNNFDEIVTSKHGIKTFPFHLDYIESIVKNIKANDPIHSNKIFFYIKKFKNTKKGNHLKLIYNMQSPGTNTYLGSAILNCDLNMMIQNLNNRKKDSSINFIILDKQKNIIAKSKLIINKIIDDNDQFETHLKNVLLSLNFNDENFKDISYLDMVNGLNYYIKHLTNLPFILIVNIDNDIIKKNILDSVTGKFIEVCIFAILCLTLIFGVYKRETSLRAKTEKARVNAINANNAKTNFLSYTAHEIRSPLGFILTGSEIMKKEMLGKMPAVYMRYAEGIHNNSILIRDFVTDILDDNQIMEGKIKITNSIVDIEIVVHEAINVNLERFSEKKINISTKFAPKMPWLICDARRMLQVMSNLISNSIKYSENNTNIIVTTNIVKSTMEIKVIDQGIGMNPDKIPAALQIYGTVHKTNYNSLGSYGLGLPIVKMLLDAQDAFISISSFEKKGTTVTITFPKYKLVYKNNNIKKDNGTG